MSEENSKPKKLSLSGSGKLTLGGGALDQTALRGGNLGTGRGKNVQVEVRRKRVLNPALRASSAAQPAAPAPSEDTVEAPTAPAPKPDDRLTAAERANRMKVLQEGLSKSQAAPEEVSSPEPPAEEAAPEEVLDPREARRRARPVSCGGDRRAFPRVRWRDRHAG